MNTILKLREDRGLQLIMAGSAAAAVIAFYTYYRLRQAGKTPASEESDSEIHEINDRILYEYGFNLIQGKPHRQAPVRLRQLPHRT